MKMNHEDSIKAWWTEEGLAVEMPEKVARELQDTLMSLYGINIEEAFLQYIQWSTENPDEFKEWIEQIRKDEETICRPDMDD